MELFECNFENGINVESTLSYNIIQRCEKYLSMLEKQSFNENKDYSFHQVTERMEQQQLIAIK